MSDRITAPILAATIKPDKVDKLDFPLLATPKIDGIRCLKVNGKIVSRTFKPIPNEYIRQTLGILLPEGADGEIYLPYTNFNDISSAVMRASGNPPFRYAMFDICTNIWDPYIMRIQDLKDWAATSSFKGQVDPLIPVEVRSYDELLFVEGQMLQAGFEGVMLRKASSPYKCGRSTFIQQYLLKMKRFVDSEARIIGFTNKQTNNNLAITDVFGHSKRSSHNAGKIDMELLGALEVVDIERNIQFFVGSGFDDQQRHTLWQNKEELIGKVIKYRFQPVGVHEKPRFPTFVGFRSELDT